MLKVYYKHLEKQIFNICRWVVFYKYLDSEFLENYLQEKDKKEKKKRIRFLSNLLEELK
jgi:hypothetical protein